MLTKLIPAGWHIEIQQLPDGGRRYTIDTGTVYSLRYKDTYTVSRAHFGRDMPTQLNELGSIRNLLARVGNRVYLDKRAGKVAENATPSGSTSS